MSLQVVFNPENPKLVSNKKEWAKKRRNFLPTAAVSLVILTVWLVVFFLVPPETHLAPLLFLALTFLQVLFITSLIFANTRRGLLTSLGAVSFLITKYYGVGNYLTLLLIIGILVTVEYYLSTP